jgi:hypothetical protein
MALDLSWMIGRRITTVVKLDFTWRFTLDDESTVDTETFWRLVGKRVVVTSEDDGQLFGLKEPVNAASLIQASIGSGQIEHFTLDERTGDLSLKIDGGWIIQFLTTSGGYEGWRIGHGDESIICLGGGELAIFKRTQVAPKNKLEHG